MFKLQTIDEHQAAQDTLDLLKNREMRIHQIVETLNNQVSYTDVENAMVSELFGLGNLLKGIFVNPFIKRKIRKLVDELILVRVGIAKFSLEMDLNDMEDEYDADEFEDDYSSRRSGRSGRRKPKKSYGGSDQEDSVISKKVAALEDSADMLEAKMDILVGDDDRLEKYVTLQKIEARLKANDLIIAMADNVQKKILIKFNNVIGKEAKSIASDLLEYYNGVPLEKAQGTLMNEKVFDASPETVQSREKIQDLEAKAVELIAKARDYEADGEEVKAGIARMSTIVAKKKADLESINMRIKKLKKRL